VIVEFSYRNVLRAKQVAIQCEKYESAHEDEYEYYREKPSPDGCPIPSLLHQLPTSNGYFAAPMLEIELLIPLCVEPICQSKLVGHKGQILA
jgi:hypothetical protein